MIEKDIVYSNPIRINVNTFELTKTSIIVVQKRDIIDIKSHLANSSIDIDKILVEINKII